MVEPIGAARVHLPANRAFVIQLAASLTAERPFHGRVEHLSSGAVMHFKSLDQLAEFITQVVEKSEEDR